MKKLLSFGQRELRVIPLGVLGAAGVFLFILLMEASLGSVFYSLSVLGFSNAPRAASVVANLGLWLTKLAVIVTLVRLAGRPGGAEAESPFKRRVEAPLRGQLALWTLLLVASARLAYDSWFGGAVLALVGTDEGLAQSMDLILGVPWLGALYLVIAAPVAEEILYRGVIFNGLLRKGLRPPLAALFSAALFGLVHLSPAQGINAFAIGLLAAFVYHQTGNLKSAIGLHFANNLMVLALSGRFAEWTQKIPTGQGLGLTLVGTALLAAALAGYRSRAAKLALSGEAEEAPGR